MVQANIEDAKSVMGSDLFPFYTKYNAICVIPYKHFPMRFQSFLQQKMENVLTYELRFHTYSHIVNLAKNGKHVDIWAWFYIWVCDKTDGWIQNLWPHCRIRMLRIYGISALGIAWHSQQFFASWFIGRHIFVEFLSQKGTWQEHG